MDQPVDLKDTNCVPLMVAFSTAAPLGSVTVPRMIPVICCACALKPHAATSNSTAKTLAGCLIWSSILIFSNVEPESYGESAAKHEFFAQKLTPKRLSALYGAAGKGQ